MAHLAEKAKAKVHEVAHKVENTLGTGPHLNHGYNQLDHSYNQVDAAGTPYAASGAAGYHPATGGTSYMPGRAAGYHHMGGAPGGRYHHAGRQDPFTDGAGSFVDARSGIGAPHAGALHVPALGGQYHRRPHHHHGKQRRPGGAGINVAGGQHQILGGPAGYGGSAGPHFGGRPTGFFVGGGHVAAPGGRHGHHHRHHRVGGGHHHFGGRPVSRIMHPVRGGNMQQQAYGSY